MVITTPNQCCLDRVLFGQNYWFHRDVTHVVILNPKTLHSVLKEIGFESIEVKTTQPLHFLVAFAPIFKMMKIKSQTKHSRFCLLNQLRNVYRVSNNIIPSSRYGAIIYSFAMKPKR